MGYKAIAFKLTGVAPLLMHAGELADPLNPVVKEMKKITEKGSKKRTDTDDRRLAELEWAGSLYLSTEEQVILRSDVLEAMVVAAARNSRKGKDAERAVFVSDDAILDYQHKPKKKFDVTSLVDSGDWQKFSLRVGAKIGKSRVMRTRPLFREWSTHFTLQYDESMFNKQALIEIMAFAGPMVGIGDWRPKYGRFEAALG